MLWLRLPIIVILKILSAVFFILFIMGLVLFLRSFLSIATDDNELPFGIALLIIGGGISYGFFRISIYYDQILASLNPTDDPLILL